ncbi:MAG: TonB-dependent receptor [Woeseiaceae bacterium]
MTRYTRIARRRLAGLAAVGVLGPAPAFAETSTADESAALEEIIVTARKTEERVQDVPMSIQVLSAEFLDTTDPTHFFDLQNSVPGLVVNNVGLHGAGFSLRAVADQGGSSLSVATHLNGVYLGTSNLSTTRLFDLERVEVLKGPQGTLYGRNATGGSINLITRSPQPEFSADVEAAYGSFATARVQGHVNLPFGRSALRIAGIASDGDGFIRNSADGRRFAEKDFRGARASYRIDVTGRLRIDAMAQHVVDDGAVGELWLPNPEYLPDPKDIYLTTVTLPDPHLTNESDIVTVNVGYELGHATLTAVSGYADNTIRDLDDCAGLLFLAGCIRGTTSPARTRQFSQEIRLASAGGERFDWLAGVYYYDDDAHGSFYQYTPVIYPEPTIDRRSSAAETTVAAFGQATWQFADQWSTTFGLRLNREDHTLSTSGTGRDDSPTPVSDEEIETNRSWRVDLQYAASDDVLLYAGVSTGFKSGGITIQAGGVLDEFAPEELIAYETGIKSLWLGERLRLNAAAFSYDFRDLQVSTATVTDAGPIFETDNAARAKIAGVDADAAFNVTANLAVAGGAVWLPRREFVDYRNDLTGDVLSGNDLARAPEWSLSAALDYGYPLPRGARLSVRLEYNYRSGYFYTVDNNPNFAQDAFGLVNLFLRFVPASDTWYLFASGRNLADEAYFNQVFIQASPGFPRTVEAGFGYRF